MPSAVLNASAVIALLRGEPGALHVAAVIGDAIISAINLQEVCKHVLDKGAGLDVRAHDTASAWHAAGLSAATRHAGSSLGDRSCMALAIAEGVPAMAADKAWASVTVPGLEVHLIR